MTRSLITLMLFVFLATATQAATPLQQCRELARSGKLSDAIPHCQPLADAGSGEANFWLSNIYTLGDDQLAPDLDKALVLLTRAAEADYGPACFNLAALYDRGELFERSPRTAFHWYQRGAQAGHLPSQVHTGIAYLKGRGTGIDFDKARLWLTKAAEGGDQSSQITLAILVRETEPQLSMYWYQKAASQGNSFAFHELAEIYADGLLEQQQDLTKAISYARKSVSLGRDASQFLLDQLLLRQHHQANRDGTEAPLTTAASPPRQKEAMAVAAVRGDNAEPGVPGLRDADWLMAQPSDRYVVQLIQLSRKAAVQQFIEKNGLQGQVNYFRARTGAGNVYVVIYAETAADRRSAGGLSARLPGTLKDEVWVRSFAAIQSSFVPVETDR